IEAESVIAERSFAYAAAKCPVDPIGRTPLPNTVSRAKNRIGTSAADGKAGKPFGRPPAIENGSVTVTRPAPSKRTNQSIKRLPPIDRNRNPTGIPRTRALPAQVRINNHNGVHLPPGHAVLLADGGRRLLRG